MQIANISFSFIKIEPDTENQIFEEITVSKTFHTEDDALDEEAFKKRIFDKLVNEFTLIALKDAGIHFWDDIELNLSVEV